MTTTQDIVARLWNLCHVLRDDGITYHEYVTELTFLLFLKMAKETGTEEQLPAGYRWDDVQRQEGVDQLAFYRSLLVHLGNEGSGRVQAIFHQREEVGSRTVFHAATVDRMHGQLHPAAAGRNRTGPRSRHGWFFDHG